MFVCMRLVSFRFLSILVLQGLVRRLKRVKQQKLIWSYMALNTRKGIENEIEKFSCDNRFPVTVPPSLFPLLLALLPVYFEESNEWGALKIMIALEVFLQGKVLTFREFLVYFEFRLVFSVCHVLFVFSIRHVTLLSTLPRIATSCFASCYAQQWF